MKRLSIQCGILGSTLGILAGLVELGIGAQIRPWIGDKESSAMLGLVTCLLSGMALAAFTVARRREMQTNDGKLAIFLSALLSAAICFTTVGRLWYLPGTLLMVAVALLAHEFWMTPHATVSSGTSGCAWRFIAGIGSLVILLSIALAFWKSAFGLFHAEVSVMADRICFDVLQTDCVRCTALSNGEMINVEDGRVRTIYIFLILGATFAFIASLTASPLFVRIGGGVAFLGLLLCPALLPAILPGILAQVNCAHGCLNLLRSLGWGWHLSTAGVVLILCAIPLATLGKPRDAGPVE